MALSKTAERAIAAYGGADIWKRSNYIETTLSARGLAFRLKWQSPLRYARVRVEIAEPRARVLPIDSAGNTGILEGLDVRIEDGGGNILERRTAARDYFPYGRRLWWWDRLDQAYEALGSWAKASMVILEHGTWNGIVYWSLRRGTPTKADGEARSGPVMVEIRVHEWRLV
mgnify:CR=1 FL=1